MATVAGLPAALLPPATPCSSVVGALEPESAFSEPTDGAAVAEVMPATIGLLCVESALGTRGGTGGKGIGAFVLFEAAAFLPLAASSLPSLLFWARP